MSHAAIKRIGLVGGIGAGKSTVARAFGALGCVVSDSDAGARAAMKLDEVKRALRQWWGDRVFDPSGEVDRGEVARIVFADAAQRARLEAIIHPILHRQREDLIAHAAAAGVPAVVIDAPLLIEAGLDAQCDIVVFVDAPEATRLERVRSSRGWSEQEFRRREAAQMPLDQKRSRAGAVIINDGRHDLAEQCRAVLASLR